MGELPSRQEMSGSANGGPIDSPSTAHDVFICHSTSDASVARAACEALEQSGLRCWIAPRDIMPGKDWSGAIVEGIDGCRVLVVVFSTRANESQEVLREVVRASRNRKRLLAVRVENIEPTGGISYFLSATQWLDAFPPPLQPRLVDLVEATRTLLGLEVLPPPEPDVTDPDFHEVDLDDFGRSGQRGLGFVRRLFEDRR